MKTKLLLPVVIAVLFSGCESLKPDGCSLGFLTTKIPGGPGPVDSKQIYGLMFSLHWNFEKGVKAENGKENISNEKSGPGSGTRQGSVSSQGAAVRLANQPGGKGERRSQAETPPLISVTPTFSSGAALACSRLDIE